MSRVPVSVLLRFVEAWGYDAQLDMMIEEASELTKAIIKLRRKGWTATNPKTGRTYQEELQEETADVLLMAEQIAVIAGKSEVERLVQEKLRRTLALLDGSEQIIQEAPIH